MQLSDLLVAVSVLRSVVQVVPSLLYSMVVVPDAALVVAGVSITWDLPSYLYSASSSVTVSCSSVCSMVSLPGVVMMV